MIENGRINCWEHTVRSQTSDEARPREESEYLTVGSSKADHDATGFEFDDKIREVVDSSRVDRPDALHIEHHAGLFTRVGANRCSNTFHEIFAIGKKQRPVESVHEQTRERLRPFVVHLNPAVKSGALAEDGVVGTGDSTQREQHRQTNSDEHASEQIDADHRQAGDHGQSGLGSAERGNPTKAIDVDHGQRSSDYDGRKTGSRNFGKHGAANEQERYDSDESCEA